MRPKDETVLDKIIDNPRSKPRDVAAAVQAKALSQLVDQFDNISHQMRYAREDAKKTATSQTAAFMEALHPFRDIAKAITDLRDFAARLPLPKP